MYMENTTLCYLIRNGKYLMLHRVKKRNDLNKDKWIGVGGHFIEGESPWDCVMRETLEETGFMIDKAEYRGIVTFVYTGDKGERITEYMHLFTADGFTGEVTDCDEGELVWIPKDEVYMLPVWEGDRIFFKLLEEEESFFSLKLVYDETDRLISHTVKIAEERVK